MRQGQTRARAEEKEGRGLKVDVNVRGYHERGFLGGTRGRNSKDPPSRKGHKKTKRSSPGMWKTPERITYAASTRTAKSAKKRRINKKD